MTEIGAPPTPFDQLTPEQAGLRRLRQAAVLLVAVGVFETVLLIDAIRSQRSFSGGSLFYVWAGWQLLRRSAKTYRYVVRAAPVLLSLILGGCAVALLSVVQFLLVAGIPLTYAPEDHLLLYTLAYLLPVTWLLYNLHHPHTRALFDLPPTDGSPRTLFLQRWIAGAVVVGAVILGGLLAGPHALRNPFAIVVRGVVHSDAVASRVGRPVQLRLHSVSVFNWTFMSAWTVAGTQAQARYSVSIDPVGAVTITDAPPNNRMHQTSAAQAMDARR